ncbi:hypothetical protein [Solirubrobacter soli]|uniref:hypothetical protein n=1 Tax=Solirubrobacter soli TaxID=363832 RepID=UPI0004059198|nr:hypothetical protein [Solirubrobacter soli]
MRVLLVSIGLLLLPAGVADARPVCGAATARTLAANGEARIYWSSTRTYACMRGHRPIALGRVQQYRLAGHYAAVVRERRVTVHDLRRRVRTVRGTPGDPVRQLLVTASGVASWIAGRTAYINAHPLPGQTVALAGSVLVTDDHGYYALDWVSDYRTTAAGTLLRVGNLRVEAADGSVYVRYRDHPRRLIGEAYLDDSASAGGGLEALWVVGTTVYTRSYFYGIGGDPAGADVQVLRAASGRTRTFCRGDAVGDVVVTTGGVACVVDEPATTRIDSNGLILDRFDRTTTTLTREGDRLTWRHDGQTVQGPLPGEVPCGPPTEATLIQSATARVYRNGAGIVGCAGPTAIALGAAKDFIGVAMAGRFAAVHRRGETLTVYDLTTGAITGTPASASGMKQVAVGDTGIGAYLTADGAGDTVTGAYPDVDKGVSLRVRGPLVVWRGRRTHLHVAGAEPIADGVVTVGLQITGGRLVTWNRVDLGAPAEVAAIEQSDLRIAVLTTGHELTVRDYDGTNVTRPCPPPVRDFTLDDHGRVTCS